MTTYKDRYGFALTTQSAAAAAHYQEGVDLLLSMWPGEARRLDAAIAADPDFALAHAARARLYAIRAQTDAAKAAIARAAALAEKNDNTTARERSHVNVLQLAITGQSARALTAAREHLERWPCDILIFSLPMGAFGLLAFSGMADHDQARADLCDRHARHFPADDWWFLTYRGWSHGENGNVKLGHRLTERALQIRPANANAAHAHAHVCYEMGASTESEAFIADWLPSYECTGILHGHIAWHGALLALERGDTGQALALYRQHVAPAVNQGLPINLISDAAGLLWRMYAYGHAVPPDLWQDAARYASGYFQAGGFAFMDVHMALIAAATGDDAALAARAQTLDDLLAADKLPAGPVVPAVCRAVQAFAQQRYADCARILEPLAHEVVRLGGSGAQREIFEDTLLQAWLRSGDVDNNADKARALLTRRLHRRPSVRDDRWLAA